MLEEFTDYLRASLGQLRRADSTLAAELTMVECYLQLMRLRMGDAVDFSIDASAEARSAVVPPLLLQPLVENAVRHGLAPRDGNGTVHVHATVRGGRLAIAVRDDGAGLRARLWDGEVLQNFPGRGERPAGGYSHLTTNFEYIYRVNDPIRLVAWADVGRAFGYKETFDVKQLRYTFGGELRLFLPVFQFPVRFIYAINPNAQDTLIQEKKRVFRFSIGRTF